MVRNGIPRVCYHFCSTERNSELFSLPRKDSERNSASMLLFLIHGTEFRVVFSSAEGFGMEFREFLFRGTAGIPPEITIYSVNSVFRGIIFLSEIPNPKCLPLILLVSLIILLLLREPIQQRSLVTDKLKKYTEPIRLFYKIVYNIIHLV
jgi:hypothetical protein